MFESFLKDSLKSSKYEKLSFNVLVLVFNLFSFYFFKLLGFLAIDSIFAFTKLQLNFDILNNSNYLINL